jgi:predicted transcriptional regulator
MTKLLDEAIEKIREMPEAEQNLAAEVLFNIAEKKWEPERLDPATRAAILEGLAQAERGELVSDEEMAKFFRQRGV